MEREFSGYKLGYIYNSNSFNKNGWETSVELYSIKVTETGGFSSSSSKNKLIPSISFGYHF